MSNIPDNLLYTSHDEWILREGGTVTVGITDFAQSQLGDLVHVELPEQGSEFAAGDVVCEVESVKAVAEIYAPFAGTVVAVNEALEDDAEVINTDAYGSWIFKLELADADATIDLLDPTAYAAKLG